MPLLYAGIDEAGYGPLLGPLCVGCSAFVIEQPVEEPHCLWSLLRSAVCRTLSDPRRRICVQDSKKLKGARGAAGHPLRHLERGVAAFAATLPEGTIFDQDAALLAHLGAPVTPGEDAWHGAPLPLPVGNDAGSLRIGAASLRTAMEQTGVRTHRLAVEAMSAREFNAQSARFGNKATINFMAAMRHADTLRRAAAIAGLECWIALDRQGGRQNYLDTLRTSFPEARIRVLLEQEETARYRLEWPVAGGLPNHNACFSFEMGGEERNFTVALASMAAKFVRELHMRRMNEFFAAHVAELKPTAGYVQDGRRFLEEVLPTAQRLGIPHAALARER